MKRDLLRGNNRLGGQVFGTRDRTSKSNCVGSSGRGLLYLLYVANRKLGSPIKRDLGILLRLHRFLIIASCDLCHKELYRQLIAYL